MLDVQHCRDGSYILSCRIMILLVIQVHLLLLIGSALFMFAFVGIRSENDRDQENRYSDMQLSFSVRLGIHPLNALSFCFGYHSDFVSETHKSRYSTQLQNAVSKEILVPSGCYRPCFSSLPGNRSTRVARSESSSWRIKVASVMSSGCGLEVERIKKGWILSVISGVWKVNILDKMTLEDKLDTTE